MISAGKSPLKIALRANGVAVGRMREVVRGLDVEACRDERPDHGPLVQPEAVHHDQERAPVRVQHRLQEFGADVHREGRPVAVVIVQPAGVVALQVAGEVLPEALLQRPERVLQPRLVRLPQPHLPLRQLGHQLHPLAPGQRTGPARLQLAEPGGEVAGEALLADTVAVEQPGHHRQDLPRVDRLDQVVRDVRPDGVLECFRFLALGHHDHRHAVVDGPDGAEQLEPATARHLLVQQHDAVGLPLEQRQGVVAVGAGLDGETLLFQKQDVRREALHLIVDPENGFGPGHGGKVRREMGKGHPSFPSPDPRVN